MVARNVRWRGGEIDILAWDRRGIWVVIEVRGRGGEGFAPSRFLSPAKRRRLLTYAARLGRARVELWECRGQVPAHWLKRFLAGLSPGSFGITWTTYRLE